MKNKTEDTLYSSFWLDDTTLEELENNDKESSISQKIDAAVLKLASNRKAIANFVSILTGEDIPVTFHTGNTSATDGKQIYISSDINSKEDFDVTVGIALHESSHILFTDFELVKSVWGRISELHKLGKRIKLEKEAVDSFVKTIINYVEDRYIDDFVFRTAPGYRPYYISLYNKYFNHKDITKSLKSNMLKEPTLSAYEIRIINLTNVNTDLNALPGLRTIAEILNLKNINRLTTPKDRITVGVEIAKVVFENIKDFSDNKTNKKEKMEVDSSENIENQNISIESDLDNSNDDDDDDIIGGSETNAKSNDASDLDFENEEFGDTSNVSKAQVEKLKKALAKQKKFLDGHKNVKKKGISESKKQLLSIVEKSGISLVQVGKDIKDKNQKALPIECVLVKKLTSELLFSGSFPLYQGCKKFLDSTKVPDPPLYVKNAVIKGISLGTALGHKLQIRQEINSTKYMRRNSGKIDRRVLANIGCGEESIFYKMKYDKYDKLNLHISVDASGSMSDVVKWTKTITMVVAICKAASMIDNLRVSVSFRTTIQSSYNRGGGYEYLPYIVIAYDSAKDKFSKVSSMFKYLVPTGSTPEGLTFEAIMDWLKGTKTDETYYFLNISDGDPCFRYYANEGKIVVNYDSGIGVEHTRKQVQKLLNSGVKINSYFIGEKYMDVMGTSTFSSMQVNNFKRMYGSSAKFVDINNIISIAKTMNELFLNKE